MFSCHANKSDPTYDHGENVFDSSKTNYIYVKLKQKELEKTKKLHMKNYTNAEYMNAIYMNAV